MMFNIFGMRIKISEVVFKEYCLVLVRQKLPDRADASDIHFATGKPPETPI